MLFTKQDICVSFLTHICPLLPHSWQPPWEILPITQIPARSLFPTLYYQRSAWCYVITVKTRKSALTFPEFTGIYICFHLVVWIHHNVTILLWSVFLPVNYHSLSWAESKQAISKQAVVFLYQLLIPLLVYSLSWSCCVNLGLSKQESQQSSKELRLFICASIWTITKAVTLSQLISVLPCLYSSAFQLWLYSVELWTDHSFLKHHSLCPSGNVKNRQT